MLTTRTTLLYLYIAIYSALKTVPERAEPTTSKMKAEIENEVHTQRQIETELDKQITQEEITKTVAKLKPTGPGFSGAHAACVKAVFGRRVGRQQVCLKIV